MEVWLKVSPRFKSVLFHGKANGGALKRLKCLYFIISSVLRFIRFNKNDQIFSSCNSNKIARAHWANQL